MKSGMIEVINRARGESEAWPTMFDSTGEILDPGYRAIVLPLWFVQLHSGPEASRELGATTETQASNLRKNTIIHHGMSKQKHNLQKQDMMQQNWPVHRAECENTRAEPPSEATTTYFDESVN